MSILVIVLCLVVSFIFSGIEAGILSVNRVRLAHRAKQREAAALKLERLLAKPDRLLITVLVVTNMANIFALVLGTLMLVEAFGRRGYAVGLAIYLPLYLFALELLPKSIFRRFPYRALAFLAEPLRLANLLLTPMHVVGLGLTRLFGGGEAADKKLFAAREDFKYLTIETERAGSLSNVERKMIHGVVDFRAVTAREVMVPVEKVQAIDANADLAELIARARETGLDRWPVRNETGTFTGLVNLLDVALSDRRSGPASSLQRRIVKLSPNEPAYTVLHKLRAARTSMAAVLDSDGRPIGIVTWENVIMRLVQSAVS